MDVHELMLRRSLYICVLALVNARFSILKKQKPFKLNLSPGVVLYVLIFKDSLPGVLGNKGTRPFISREQGIS